MNKVQQILASITDADLRSAVQEMAKLDATGILPKGIVRELAKKISIEAEISAHDANSIAQTSVLRIAAFKWADVDGQRAA